MEIRCENTAISNGIAKSIIQYHNQMEGPILDYGAGKLRNAKFLVNQGFSVDVLDTPLQVSRWSEEDKSIFKNTYEQKISTSKKYKTVLSTFVLNVVSDPNERNHILQNAYNCLEPNGKLICEVRQYGGVLKNKHLETYGDGYLVGSGNVRTFQKPFTAGEISDLVAKFFTVSEVRVMSDSIIVIGVK